MRLPSLLLVSSLGCAANGVMGPSYDDSEEPAPRPRPPAERGDAGAMMPVIHDMPPMPGEEDPPPPTGPESCDGVDNDGNGRIDEGCACTPRATQACWPGAAADRGVGTCADGVQTCVAAGEFGAWGECVGAVLPGPGGSCAPPPPMVMPPPMGMPPPMATPEQCRGVSFTLDGDVQVLSSRGSGSSGNSCRPVVHLRYTHALPNGSPSGNTTSYNGGIFREFDAAGCDRGRFHLRNVEVACFSDRVELRKIHIVYDSGCYECSQSGFTVMDHFRWNAATPGSTCTPQMDGSLLCNGPGSSNAMRIEGMRFSAM